MLLVIWLVEIFTYYFIFLREYMIQVYIILFQIIYIYIYSIYIKILLNTLDIIR